MTLHLTGLYACALTAVFIALQYNVILRRGAAKISINYNDDMVLAEKIRRHGNFIETVPLALILMASAESVGASAVWLHAIGALLLIGRVLHPLGLKHDVMVSPLRIAGTMATQFSMFTSVACIVWLNFNA